MTTVHTSTCVHAVTCVCNHTSCVVTCQCYTMHGVGGAFTQHLVTHTPCFNTKKANTQHTGLAPNTCEQEQHATRNITHMRDPGEGLRNMEIVASGACVPHSLFIEKRGISFHSVYAISSGQRHSVFVWISHGPRLI